MAGKRNYEWPLATEWDAAAFLTQDKSGGVTQRVSPALVETKLEADGFPKIPSPTTHNVAVYGAGGWSTIKLTNTHIDAAAAIGWGKISKTGAVASDIGALPDVSPTVVSGKLTTAASTTSGASLNFPNGAVPTSPAVGDIWADASRLFMQGRVLAVTKGASNSFGSGSAFSVLDAASPTKGAHIQLNAAGGIDVWTLQGGSWIKELTLPIDGSIQLENLAGTGTRPVAVDSAGKLVDASTGLSGSGTMAAMINGSGQIERSTNLKDNGPGGMEFIRPPIMPAPINNAPNLRLAPGSDPTTLIDGDLWFDGASLKIRIGGVTRTVTVT